MRAHAANQQLEQFRWLKRNLELQLEDIEFERLDKKITLYFDTANVQPAVLGLRAYYDGRVLAKGRFHHREATVNSLLASMLLGRFSMLPPHLSEFYRKVESQFEAGISRRWDDEALKFLKEAGLLEEAGELLNLSSESEIRAIIDHMSGPEIRRLAGDQVRIAQLWFNAVNCLLPWQRRLKLWLDSGYFVLEGSALNYNDLITSPRFADLKEQLDAQRPGTTVNNFVDAASICYLLHLTAELNAGRSDIVPRFYVSQQNNTFQGAIEALDLEQELVCLTKGPTKPGSPVMRDFDYFLFRLTFRPLQKDGDGDGVPESSSVDRDEATLRRLYEKVSESIDKTKGLSDEQVQQYAEGLDDVYEGQSLHEIITDLKRISFIEKNWFGTRMATDLMGILEQMKQVREVVESQRYIYENERFRQAVLEEFKGKNKELDESLEEFRWVSTLWDPLLRGAELLKKRHKTLEETEQGDLFRDLGLLRYGFPQRTHKEIRKILGGLCAQEQDLTRGAVQKAVKAYVLGRRAPDGQSDRLTVATAVLVAARLNEKLLELFRHVRRQMPLPHYSLKISYAELLFREKEQNDDSDALAEAEGLLRELEEEYAAGVPEADRPHMSVGLAYLYYRSWRIRHGLADWYDSSGEQAGDSCRCPDVLPLIEKAIKHSREAYGGLGDENMSKKAYALNQVLYYSVEGCAPVSFEEHQPLARSLARYRFQPRFWQYRFDDTLARYNLRLFHDAPDVEGKKSFIKLAKDHSEAAQRKSGGDEEVKTFLMHLEQVEIDFTRKLMQSR